LMKVEELAEEIQRIAERKEISATLPSREEWACCFEEFVANEVMPGNKAQSAKILREAKKRLAMEKFELLEVSEPDRRLVLCVQADNSGSMEHYRIGAEFVLSVIDMVVGAVLRANGSVYVCAFGKKSKSGEESWKKVDSEEAFRALMTYDSSTSPHLIKRSFKEFRELRTEEEKGGVKCDYMSLFVGDGRFTDGYSDLTGEAVSAYQSPEAVEFFQQCCHAAFCFVGPHAFPGGDIEQRILAAVCHGAKGTNFVPCKYNQCIQLDGGLEDQRTTVVKELLEGILDAVGSSAIPKPPSDMEQFVFKRDGKLWRLVYPEGDVHKAAQYLVRNLTFCEIAAILQHEASRLVDDYFMKRNRITAIHKEFFELVEGLWRGKAYSVFSEGVNKTLYQDTKREILSKELGGAKETRLREWNRKSRAAILAAKQQPIVDAMIQKLVQLPSEHRKVVYIATFKMQEKELEALQTECINTITSATTYTEFLMKCLTCGYLRVLESADGSDLCESLFPVVVGNIESFEGVMQLLPRIVCQALRKPAFTLVEDGSRQLCGAAALGYASACLKDTVGEFMYRSITKGILAQDEMYNPDVIRFLLPFLSEENEVSTWLARRLVIIQVVGDMKNYRYEGEVTRLKFDWTHASSIEKVCFLPGIFGPRDVYFFPTLVEVKGTPTEENEKKWPGTLQVDYCDNDTNRHLLPADLNKGRPLAMDSATARAVLRFFARHETWPGIAKLEKESKTLDENALGRTEINAILEAVKTAGVGKEPGKNWKEIRGVFETYFLSLPLLSTVETWIEKTVRELSPSFFRQLIAWVFRMSDTSTIEKGAKACSQRLIAAAEETEWIGLPKEASWSCGRKDVVPSFGKDEAPLALPAFEKALLTRLSELLDTQYLWQAAQRMLEGVYQFIAQKKTCIVCRQFGWEYTWREQCAEGGIVIGACGCILCGSCAASYKQHAADERHFLRADGCLDASLSFCPCEGGVPFNAAFPFALPSTFRRDVADPDWPYVGEGVLTPGRAVEHPLSTIKYAPCETCFRWFEALRNPQCNLEGWTAPKECPVCAAKGAPEPERMQRCPGCSTPYLHVDACNHMQCPNSECKVHFCMCGADITYQAKNDLLWDDNIGHFGRNGGCPTYHSTGNDEIAFDARELR